MLAILYYIIQCHGKVKGDNSIFTWHRPKMLHWVDVVVVEEVVVEGDVDIVEVVIGVGDGVVELERPK